MILTLDVGNSNIHGVVFDGPEVRLEFRRTTTNITSDEVGLFLRGVIRENGLDWRDITAIGFCTVVPDAVHALRNACRKYFETTPFVLAAGVKTGLKIRYRNPSEVGADRIANAIGLSERYPDRNGIAVDFGTATTFEVVTADKEYLGGVIAPGLRLSVDALGRGTAKLSSVEIIAPDHTIGRSAVEGIQSGVWFGHVGMIKEVVERVTEEAFGGVRPVIVGSGGFAGLFEDAGIFDEIVPDLVPRGIRVAMVLNGEMRESTAPERPDSRLPR